MPAASDAVLASRPLDAHDLRLGGSWTRLQHAKNDALFVVIVATLAVVDRLPFAVLEWTLRRLGSLAYVLGRESRRKALAAIREQLPEADATKLAKQCFVRAGTSLAECLLLRRTQVSALALVHVPDEDRRTLERALRDGRGAVVASAHLGAFELVPAVVAELGLRPAVVVRESYDPRLDVHVDRHRLGRGVRVVHRGKPGAAFGLLRALRDGHPLGVLADLPGRVPAHEAPFLAGRRNIASGPARLASRAGTPLLVCTLAPSQPGDGASVRYRLRVLRLSTSGSEDLITRRVSRAIGDSVRAMPAAFPWMA